MSGVIQLSFTKSSPSINLNPAATQEVSLPFAQVITVTESATTFTWTQSIPLSVWTIPHNLNKFPCVAVVDTLGNVIYPDVSYVDSNIVQITHGSAFAGKAYLN